MVKTKIVIEGLSKNFVIGLIAIGLFIYMMTSGVLSPVKNNNTSSISGNITVEVIHFHATAQCYSCITVGEIAERTVNQLNNPKITMKHVNIDLSENRDIVTKYGATSSAIMIGVYNDNEFHKEENINVWYKISNATDYFNYFSALLSRRLNGDFS